MLFKIFDTSHVKLMLYCASKKKSPLEITFSSILGILMNECSFCMYILKRTCGK